MSSPHPGIPPGASAEACPVDHKTREAWLKNNRPQETPFASLSSSTIEATKNTSANCTSAEIAPTQTPKSLASSSTGSSSGWLSWLSSPFSSSSTTTSQQTSKPPPSKSSLGTDREISTIPRASSDVPEGHGAAVLPANSEAETGMSKSGNWVYPSEKMFFDAMKRKGYSSKETDMQMVVPIHNAVNERAWKEIKEWERPWGSEQRCGGPKLHSFIGLSTSLSPKARFNTLLGYTAPFDRHDWVVDRCGTKVDYVIDFYSGKDDGRGNGKLNFYLDVRPKLNTWEGWKMRAAKTVGYV